jgi:hypothetical protein
MPLTECNLARIWIIKSFDQTNYGALASTARTNLNKEMALEISRRFKSKKYYQYPIIVIEI